MATRIIMFYLISSLIKNFFGSKQPVSDTNLTNAPSKVYPPSMNMFSPGELFDYYMYISPEQEDFDDFDNPEALVWQERHLIYGDWSSGPFNDGSRVKALSFPTPPILQNNGSLYLHVFVTKLGRNPNPKSTGYVGREVCVF